MSDTSPSPSRHPAYRGPEPFVFVCYSHREEQRIEAEIAALSARGIRIYYDEGIEPGGAWQEEVADKIETCRAFLIFVSKHSVVSHDCRRELTFALTAKRPVVPVHLDDLELPPALRLQLGDRQAIIRSRFTEPEYRERLATAMLKYQNAAPAIDSGAHFDTHAPAVPTTKRVRRRVLVAVLIALAMAASTLAIFKPQLGGGWRVFDTAVKREGIAVLPFENASGRAEDEYLSEGLSDELRDQFSRVHGLRVVARPSSIVFRGQHKAASTIAKELGVAAVVEGSLRKDGDSLHIVVRLVDTATDAQLWSQSYDRNARDLLAVQQDIALAAAKQILPQVDAKQIPAPALRASVTGVTDLMLLRDYARNAVTPKDWDKPVSLYRQVLDVDPGSAPAHARLAQALFLQGTDLEDAERHAQRSIQIDPTLAEGHSYLANILASQYRHGAAKEYARAVELNPNDAEALHAYGVFLIGRFAPGPDGTSICAAPATSIRPQRPRPATSPGRMCSGRAKRKPRRICGTSRNVFQPRPAASCSPGPRNFRRQTGPGNSLGDGGAASGS